MSSAPKTPSNPPAAPPAKSASNIVRIVLFAVLAYMVFALAYDYLFVFKAHPKKFEEVQALIEKETSRSAEDREKNGPVTNKEVMEVIGFAPSQPLTQEDHYFHERYTWHRGLPWMTRDIDVFYIGTKDKPVLFSAAYMADDVEESKPRKAIMPDTTPAPSTDEKKSEEKQADEPAPAEEKKADEPAPIEEKKADEPAKEEKAEPKADEAAPAPADEKKDE